MGWLKRWRTRLAPVARPEHTDAELAEEIAFHLEQETAKFIRAGLAPDEAARRARMAFGTVDRFRGEVHDARTLAWLATLGRDLRYAVRGMGHRPGFVLAILLTLALSIGASVAMFATSRALFFQPLPFAQAERLHMLYETNPEFGWTDAQAAPANVLDWRERVRAFEDVGAYLEFENRATYVQDGEPHLLKVAAVTGNFFDILGARPLLGRGFRWEETWRGASNVAVLSHARWTATFASDTAIIGRSVRFGDTMVEIVGVMPRGFAFPFGGTDLWMPMGWAAEDRAQVWFRRAHFVRPIAKLAAGITAAQADAAFQVEVARLRQEFPETNRVMGAGMMPLRGFLVRTLRTPVLILAGAVAVLLLLACANVANLALLRALGRQHEIALRSALGAGRARIVSMLLIEHAVLALLGAALGVAVAWVALRLLGFSEFGVPAATAVAFDSRVGLFALVAAVGCALSFSAAPVLLALRQGRDAQLQGSERGAAGGKRNARLIGGLVALEVALALVLVVGAGLMAKTALRLRRVDVGFRSEQVLAVELTVPASRYPALPQVTAFYDRLLAELEARPGIVRAGTVANLPLAGPGWSSQFRAEGWPADRAGLNILHRRADLGYFEALGTPLVRGRHLAPSDRADAPPAVVINETFAREFFPDEDPIGRRIAYDRVATANSTWREIVGIVRDQAQVSPAEPARAEVFESRAQDVGRNMWVVLRTDQTPMSVLPSVREVLRALDPLLPIATVRTLDEVRAASMARENTVLGLLTAFGGLAVVLAAVGVYAVAAQSVRQRTREIGIRIALGASSGDVLRLVLIRGVAFVALGLAAGLALTLVATRALDSLLYGVESTDTGTIAAVAALLLVVGVVACWIPARWATRLDPVRALKLE